MLLFILISLASASKVIQITDENQDYSVEVTQSEFNETYTFLTDSSVDYYYFQINISTLQEGNQVALAASQSQAPYFDSSNKLIYELFDTDGYLLKKQQFYLTLTKSTDPYYITILSDQQITYSIKAYLKYSKPCSENCQLHGACQSGKCYCNYKWIGDDCTLPANKITKDLTSFKSGYFYQNFLKEESIYFDITSSSDGNIYFLFETNQIGVPTMDAYDFKLELIAEEPQKFNLIYEKQEAQTVIIYVPSSVKVKFVPIIQDEITTSDESGSSSSSYDDSNNFGSPSDPISQDTIILICSIVPGVFLLIFFGVFCYKGKCKRSTVEFTVQPLNGPIDQGQYNKQGGNCRLF